MKRYEEFISESSRDEKFLSTSKFLENHYEDFDKLQRYMYEEFKKEGFPRSFFPRIEIYGIKSDLVIDGKLKYIPLHIEINLNKVEEDIPDYFNRIREMLSKYFYVKMVKAQSTDYYDVLLDFEKLINSNLYKSIIGMTKYNVI